MADLVEFIQRYDIPVLTQAAIAHAQLETIHPFPDGNGRTGRSIVSALLRNKGVTEKVTIPLSSGLLANTKSYFEALDSYQDGNPETISEMFAESTFPATDNGRTLASNIRDAQTGNYESLPHNPSESLRSTVDLLMREPALTARMLTELTGQSSSSAYRNISTNYPHPIQERHGLLRVSTATPPAGTDKSSEPLRPVTSWRSPWCSWPCWRRRSPVSNCGREYPSEAGLVPNVL